MDTKSGPALKERFTRGMIWSFLAAVVFQGLNFLSGVVCARILGREDFGKYAILQTTIGAFGVFAGMGLGLTTVKYVAQFRIADPNRAGRIIGCTTAAAVMTGTIVSFVIWLVAPWLARNSLHAPALDGNIRTASFLVLFNALSGTQSGALAGLESFSSIATVNLVGGTFGFCVLTSLVYFHGIDGAALGMVLSAFFVFAVNYFVLRRHCRLNGIVIHLRGAREEWHTAWSFSLPAFLSDLVISPVTWAAGTFLVRSPHGYEQMGVYSAANQWRTALTFIPYVAGQVLIPLIASMRAGGDHKGLRSSLKMAIGFNSLCSSPLLICLVFFAHRVMSFYGPQFADAYAVLYLTGLTGAIISVQMPVGNFFAACGHMWVGAVVNVGWAVVLLISSWFLIQHGYGAWGLALAYLIAYSLQTLCTFWFAARFFPREGFSRS